jgi:hypothetical protein
MTVTEYSKHRDTLIAYLKVKVEAHDWHGVSDAANDLRVLEAERPHLLNDGLGNYRPWKRSNWTIEGDATHESGSTPK